MNSLPVCSQLCQSCKIQTVSQYAWHVHIEQAWKPADVDNYIGSSFSSLLIRISVPTGMHHPDLALVNICLPTRHTYLRRYDILGNTSEVGVEHEVFLTCEVVKEDILLWTNTGHRSDLLLVISIRHVLQAACDIR